MLALSAVVHEEPFWAGACNGAGGQSVEHGALLSDGAGVLRATGVVAALVGARQLRGAVGVHAALGVVSYHSCWDNDKGKKTALNPNPNVIQCLLDIGTFWRVSIMKT